MDPALRELLREGTPNRVVEAIIRFRTPRSRLPGVRIVARFGRIATCRLPLGAVRSVWEHPDVLSLKASRPLGPDLEEPGAPLHEGGSPDAPGPAAEPLRRPPGLRLTGRGVVVGIVDWGLDVDHPNLVRSDGTTRLLALWDQRSRRRRAGRRSPQPYGYGLVHTRADIDRALRSGTPFRTLGYHAADADRGGGSHGAHVTDIAAGNGTVGQAGVAPAADLVFVHLAARGTGGLATMGDSVRLLEAVDFIARTAGDRPWVINLSMGQMGGPHDGSGLVEQALDELLAAAPGRFVVQSGGNYYRARTHAAGAVGAGRRRVLRFVVDPADVTGNELEIWYGGTDELTVRIDPPGSTGASAVLLGQTADVRAGGRVVGRIYHRAFDPNNGDHHIDAFLHPGAPAGEWRVTLEGRRVGSGRYDAWLERDEACPSCQARFIPRHAVPECTTGTIANGHLPLVVASYDAQAPGRPPGPTSSAGPPVTPARSRTWPRSVSGCSPPGRPRAAVSAAPAVWCARPEPAWRRPR